MTGIAEFLTARLDELEANHDEFHNGLDCASTGPLPMPCDCGYPARVLREVEAKRKILKRYELALADRESPVSFTRGQDDGYRQACRDALADLASAWSEHPDYDPAWRPDE